MSETTQGAVGVCSWSLRPESPRDLAAKLRAAGVGAVQLALDPLRTNAWSARETIDTLDAAGVEIRSGMMAMKGEDYSTLESIRRTGGVRLDDCWNENIDAAAANARMAERLGLLLVTFHAGFLPHDRSDPVRRIMIDRLRRIIDAFDLRGIAVAFETGQETADTLLDALAEIDRPTAGVNFDPANMILYGMGDPLAALRSLAPHVKQIHIKDALPSESPGHWGSEVVVGEGAIDWRAFFEVVRACALHADLMIEREAGASRLDDIIAARRVIEDLR